MSWKDTLLDAQFRGVSLEVRGDQLKGKRSLVRHGMPYRQGESVEDLGRDSRVFHLDAVIYGDAYEAALQALLAAVETPGEGELIHPIYGSVTVLVEDWTITHDAERPDYAEAALVFVENEPERAFFERTFTTSEGAVDAVSIADPRDWRDQVRDLLSHVDTLVADTQTTLGGGWMGLIETLVGLPGIGARLGQLRSQTLGVLSGLAEQANAPAPRFDPITTPWRVPAEMRALLTASVPTRGPEGMVDADGLLAGALLPRDLPGVRELPALATRTWTGIAEAARRGVAPTRDTIEVPEGLPDEPLHAHALGLVVLLVTEQALTATTAVAAVLDAQRAQACRTPQDVDRLTAQARAQLQGAIVLHRHLLDVEAARRVIEPLRQLAALLQAGARRVILARPPLLTRTVTSDTCLRVLAHHWYGDHGRATELLRLNPGLRTPYAIACGEVLRAYAQ